MNMDYVKNGMWYGSRVLFFASFVLAVLTATKVSGYMASSGRIKMAVKTAKAQNGQDEETVKTLLDEGRKAADGLKKKNMFVLPPAKPKPPVCFGIIGSSAIINGKQYKVGEKVGGAEIISVGAKEVVIKWDDKEMKLIPFAASNASSSSRRPSSSGKSAKKLPSDSKSKEPKPSKTTVVHVTVDGPGGPGGRGGFMGMSSEDRQRMMDRYRNMSDRERERFREERRRQFGGDRGGFRGRGR